MGFFIRSSCTGLKPQNTIFNAHIIKTHRHAPVRVIKARKGGVSVVHCAQLRIRAPRRVEVSAGSKPTPLRIRRAQNIQRIEIVTSRKSVPLINEPAGPALSSIIPPICPVVLSDTLFPPNKLSMLSVIFFIISSAVNMYAYPVASGIATLSRNHFIFSA